MDEKIRSMKQKQEYQKEEMQRIWNDNLLQPLQHFHAERSRPASSSRWRSCTVGIVDPRGQNAGLPSQQKPKPKPVAMAVEPGGQGAQRLDEPHSGLDNVRMTSRIEPKSSAAPSRRWGSSQLLPTAPSSPRPQPQSIEQSGRIQQARAIRQAEEMRQDKDFREAKKARWTGKYRCSLILLLSSALVLLSWLLPGLLYISFQLCFASPPTVHLRVPFFHGAMVNEEVVLALQDCGLAWKAAFANPHVFNGSLQSSMNAHYEATRGLLGPAVKDLWHLTACDTELDMMELNLAPANRSSKWSDYLAFSGLFLLSDDTLSNLPRSSSTANPNLLTRTLAHHLENHPITVGWNLLNQRAEEGTRASERCAGFLPSAFRNLDGAYFSGLLLANEVEVTENSAKSKIARALVEQLDAARVEVTRCLESISGSRNSLALWEDDRNELDKRRLGLRVLGGWIVDWRATKRWMEQHME